VWKSIKAALGGAKYNFGRLCTTTWVFGGIKWDLRRTFLAPVPHHSAEMLLGITTWILPSTTIISDCWGAYIRLGDEEFMHYVVNHSVSFNSRTGNYTSTIGAMLKHMKVSLSAYNRKVPYIFYLVETMFGVLCRARKFNPFTMLIFSVRSVDWSLLAPPTTATRIPLCIFCAGNFPAVVGLFYGRAKFIILHSVCEIPLETNSRVILKFILAPSYLM
jgi:hypothetical protein